MVKVSIEVSNGAARFSVAVRAESIEQAVGLVAGRYPKGDVWVKFPTYPEGFFVKGLVARAGIAEAEQPIGIAA